MISHELEEIDSLYVVINRTDLFVSAISGKPLNQLEASSIVTLSPQITKGEL